MVWDCAAAGETPKLYPLVFGHGLLGKIPLAAKGAAGFGGIDCGPALGSAGRLCLKACEQFVGLRRM